jgi:hypothetical protein
MQVNPVSPQPVVAEPAARTAPKPLPPQVAQQPAPKADTVVLSERAKDLAAKQTGKSVAEEMHESLTAKEREAQYQVTK